MRPSYSGYYISYGRSSILSSPPFLVEEAVYEANAAFGGGRLSRALVRDVIGKAEKGSGRLESSGLVFLFLGKEMRIYPRLDDFAMPLREGVIAPGISLVSPSSPDSLTLTVPFHLLVPPVIIRTAREGDAIELKGGRKRVSELMKDQHVPYGIVVEDRTGIAFYLSRLFGGRDRLSRRLLGQGGTPVALALIR